jgi:hypothetical protein
MTRRSDALTDDFTVCRWVNAFEALHHFATFSGTTQSQAHIKPLHWYVASRLVVEGGFRPDDIIPRPPFRIEPRGSRKLLVFDPSAAKGGERAILGGLKTKNVDVVVTKEGVGPVLAVSCKGMTGALRNLTNRLEETIGECTNLHITYPALVLGYTLVIRANREIEAAIGTFADEEADPGRQLSSNDIAVREGGEPVEAIVRIHSALRELAGRRGIRDDISRYEAIAMALVEPVGDQVGKPLAMFPPYGSPLRLETFFDSMYLRYEERFVFGAPELAGVTERVSWDPKSPAFAGPFVAAPPELDFLPRLAE